MHNTGNPLGSTSLLDLYDNAENIDYFANSQQDEVPDRFGTKRLTLAGLIKRSMALRNEINDFSGALTFKPEWSDVPMNVSEGVGGEGGALNLQAEALGNRIELLKCFTGTINFSSVTDMKSQINSSGDKIDLNLFQSGTRVRWMGYHAPSDGGGNWGILKKGAHIQDDGSIFSISPNLYIEANIAGKLSLLKWGGKRDLTFDSTTRFNAMIKYAVKDDKQDFWDTLNTGVYNRPHEIIIPSGYYSFNGNALIPSNVSIDLDNSVLVGNLEITPNYKNATVMFISAFINASGDVESNLTQPIEVGRCINSSVKNGSITNCYTGLKLKNFNENCKISNIKFYDVAINIDSFRGFYSVYEDIYSRCRNPAIVQADEPSFLFKSSTNAIKCENVNSVGRKTGMLIDGAVGEGTRTMIIRKCGFEECGTGINTLNALQPLSITDTYFEYCSVVGLDLSNASAQNVLVSSNWFGSCGIGVKGHASISLDVTMSNTFVECAVDVVLASDIESNGSVSIPNENLPRSNDTRPVIPSKYLLGKKIAVNYPVTIYDLNTGKPDVLHNFTNGIIDLPYTGDPGYVPSGVPFCDLGFSSPSLNAVDVYVTSMIPHSPWSSIIFRFEIGDKIGTHVVQGRVQGLTVFYDGGVQTYPVTLLNLNNKLRLKISGFTGSNTVNVTGIVRHV